MRKRQKDPWAAWCLAALTGGLTLAPDAAWAQTTAVTITADHIGWYNSTGEHDPGNTNYIVGFVNPYEPLYNDFFEFSLAGLAPGTTVLGASLQVSQGGSLSEYPHYATLPLDLYDVTTPTASLVAGGSGLTGIYDDLGSGVQYGAYTISTDNLDPGVLNFTLDAAAVQAIAAHEGDTFAIGGSLDYSQLPPGGFSPAFLFPHGYAEATFGATQDIQGTHLTVTTAPVPEASTTASFGLLLALALGSVLVSAKRKKKA